MDKKKHHSTTFLSRINLKLKPKLISIFIVENLIPIILLVIIALMQISFLGNSLRDLAVADSSAALNKSATENIERMTTDTAQKAADFLYSRDKDILFLSKMGVPGDEKLYKNFIEAQRGRIIDTGTWSLTNGKWVRTDPPQKDGYAGEPTNPQNNDEDSWNYRSPDAVKYIEGDVPLYDEIMYFDTQGQVLVRAVAKDSTKKRRPLDPDPSSPALLNVSDKSNTYIRSEDYFTKINELKDGEIYVSDVIGEYVGTNYIGMYTPAAIQEANSKRDFKVEYDEKNQAYAGKENPNGKRFEGIVRWITPVLEFPGQIQSESNPIKGYVSFALNHDHIMEMVDHLTPMKERYTELPSAFEGNYAFIWDYKCRSIAHPRHHSIVGFDEATGDPQVPWLETSIYDGWQAENAATGKKWFEYVTAVKTFDNQDRSKKPALELTKQGNVGLDGRFLNNAPQCTGWMDLTEKGGSGSFYIL